MGLAHLGVEWLARGSYKPCLAGALGARRSVRVEAPEQKRVVSIVAPLP